MKKWVNRVAIKNRNYNQVLERAKYFSLLDQYLRWREELKLDEEYIYCLLSQLAQEYLEKRVIRVKPTKALIGRLREFVNWVAERCSPLLHLKINEEPLKSEVEELGYKLEPKELPQTVNNLARMMAYVLMNKIVFYKLLERVYHLTPLKRFDTSSLEKFKEDINCYFITNAVEKTGDFEPVFVTGLYDRIPFPDDREFMEYINDFILTIDSIQIEKIGEQIGYIYEELIPPEERHQLGQFYTPPWVCEFITRWCIRGPEDLVFDPGVDSGGFLLKAYEELRRQKVGETVASAVPSHIHEKILEQLYALDINSFPAHLTAIGLSFRNVIAPSTKINVIPADFFSIMPKQEVLTPYTVKTVVGDIRRRFIIPAMDAVVGNPPYTRWIEIPTNTQELIKQRLGNTMKKYGLTPQVSRGIEPGIYTYWIMHATSFLKEEGGRLGMIISNTWLQTDYGIGFGNFLLDHFRIKAIIDLALKLFKGALITTCIVLAEREKDEAKRLENSVAFIHIPDEVESEDIGDIGALLEAVETGSSEKFNVILVKQRDIPRDMKWIGLFSKTIDISTHPLMVKLSKLFEPSYGNVTYLFLTSIGKIRGVRNPGSSEFHYLSPSKIKEHRLDGWAFPNVPLEKALIYPAITKARQTNFFTFTKMDWEKMCKCDDRCYMFIGHKPRQELPKEVTDYIEWGETKCMTGIRGTRKGGRLACETEAAKVRAKKSKKSTQFYGWYDLGGVVSAPIFAVRQAWYKTRFALCAFPVAMYDALIALIPKGEASLDETQTKALLAYLNSSFTQAYIETNGRKSPGGIIGFEVDIAREMPILNVKKLSEGQLSSLVKLFDELECEARSIGGASTKEQIEKLKPKIHEIDRAIAKILGIKNEEVERIEAQVDLMVERRISTAKGASM